MTDAGGGGGRDTAGGEDSAEQPRLGSPAGRALTHLGSALPPLLCAAPSDPLRSAGPATVLTCPSSAPAAASLPLAPSRTRAPGGEESDRERRLLGFGGGGGRVGRRDPLGRGITRPLLAGAALWTSGGAPLQVLDCLRSFIRRL